MQERLQKILSQKGICSRRKAEEYLQAGLVIVNGQVAILGQKADAEVDVIEVAGKVLEDRQKMIYFLLHKPSGVLTTNLYSTEEHPVPTVKDILPKKLQNTVYPIGRLDKETSGLLLLTNDGVLAYRLTHPKFDHEKEYLVYTVNKFTPEQYKQLTGFMVILGEKLKPVIIKKISEYAFTITLTEGKNRQIRRMCSKVGIGIKKLIRIRIMNITDTSLKIGKGRYLQKTEIDELMRRTGI